MLRFAYRDSQAFRVIESAYVHWPFVLQNFNIGDKRFSFLKFRYDRVISRDTFYVILITKNIHLSKFQNISIQW